MSKVKKALDRAKAERESKYSGSNVSLRRMRHKNLTNGTMAQSVRQEIEVKYEKTRIIDFDPSNLKSNKIFSHIKDSEMTDQIRILRTQVLNKLEEINGNTIMVTSAHPGEGKTFISINLAVSIAQELDRTVLLVDCDLRYPTTTHYNFASDFFGIKTTKGLSDYLIGNIEFSDILINPGVPRLTIIPGGNPIANSSELLGSPKMENLVKEIKNRYGKSRIIIFDSPSVLKISDPLTFSRFVDGILFVIEIEKTSKEDINKMLNFFKEKLIIGSIINKNKTNR